MQMQKNTSSQGYLKHSRIDHILGHKANISKFKKLKSYKHLFQPQCYDTSIMRKQSVRNTNTWRLNNTFLNNQHVTKEIKNEF